MEYMNTEESSKIKQHAAEVKSRIQQQTIGYITAGLGLVAGLAWNDAITSLIKRFFPQGDDSIAAKFVYAALITIAVVLLTMYLVKLFKKDEEKDK
jgi:hypothetical protein